MELLDRYLQAIRFWLPRAQQDDIVAELSDDIRSQIGEEESKLGRKLNNAEVASMLKQRGRPLLLANRYLPQRYLIGPLLFPVYRFVLTIVVLCYLVPWLLVWIGLMSFDPGYRSLHSAGRDLFGGLGSFWFIALLAVGVVTIVFAVLERIQSRSRFLEDWDPRKLPSVRDPIQIPRFNSILELGANLVFILWWVTSMWSQIIFERTGVRIALGPAWRGFFWAFLSVALANIALAAVNLFRPYWTWLRGSMRLAFDSAGAVAVCWLFRANILAEISAPRLSPARAAEITNAINSHLSKSFPFAVMGCVLIVALSDVGRLVRLRAGRTRLVRGLALIAALAIIATNAGAQASPANPASSSLLSDTEIHELLVDHVDAQHKSVGTVVGIISPQGGASFPMGT